MEPRRVCPKMHELVVARRGKAELERSARSVAFRARIILECSAGAAKLRTTRLTVGMSRNRFTAEGLVGLGEEARPGAPRER
jgi:hypothetical protein